MYCTKALKVSAFLIAATILFSGKVFAYESKLPEVLVGQTSVTQNPAGNTDIIYGGFTGNEVGFNWVSLDKYNIGFNPDLLMASRNGCAKDGLPNPITCFGIAPSGSGLSTLISKSYIGDPAKPVMEMGAILLSQKIINGDAFSATDYLKDFAFWGRSLAESSSGTVADSANWKVPGYVLNPQAQATWGSEQFSQLQGKVATMAGEGQGIDPAVVRSCTPWNLQAESNAICAGTNSTSLYPEGKVWVVDNASGLTLDSTFKYQGIGTIIVKSGDLTINNAVIDSVLPNDDASKLGFIVLNGRAVITGASKVRASILVMNNEFNISSGSNLEMVGSFVAKTFSIPPANGNVRFFYDYGLSKNWPPGFRQLGATPK